MKNYPLVSVIITAKNEEEVIGRLIRSIKKQSYKNIEIILVDNNSRDKTVDIAQKMGVKVYQCGPERSAQRNFGAKKSKGNYLLFMDADMELTRNVISQCVRLIVSDQKIAAMAIPEHSKAVHFWDQVKAFERSIYNEKGDPVTDAARFFKREVFFKVGAYDEIITGPEDWDLPETIMERGYKIGRVKSHINHYERTLSPLALAKKKFYYALQVHKYLQKHHIPIIGPKTVYFLRPIFYKNWPKLISNPFLTPALLIMLSAELLGGAVGYILGRLKR